MKDTNLDYYIEQKLNRDDILHYDIDDEDSFPIIIITYLMNGDIKTITIDYDIDVIEDFINKLDNERIYYVYSYQGTGVDSTGGSLIGACNYYEAATEEEAKEKAKILMSDVSNEPVSIYRVSKGTQCELTDVVINSS